MHILEGGVVCYRVWISPERVLSPRRRSGRNFLRFSDSLSILTYFPEEFSSLQSLISSYL